MVMPSSQRSSSTPSASLISWASGFAVPHRLFVALVARLGDRRPDPVVEPGPTPDPDDDDLVALARRASADALVSGDAHLTGLAGAQPPVVTPRVFLDDVLAGRLGSDRGESR
jgi:hypothetical protein